MNQPLPFRLGRAFGVALLLAAWFAMSNHCALAVLSGASVQSATDAARNCCDSRDADGGEKPDSPSGVCCKKLRALHAEAGAKLLRHHDAAPVSELPWAVLIDMNAGSHLRLPVGVAADPPGVRSFAEVVLQRSLLTHAPPFAV